MIKPGSKPTQTAKAIEESDPKPLSTSLIAEFQNLKDKFKSDDENVEKESPFMHLEKATVLQECRVFHDAAVVTQNPRKCCLLITKLLFLLVKGDSFSSAEITEVFFGVTKLFQSFDVNLRRMMYLFIKEVAETCNPDDVIIVTSSLTKDMNTGEDLYRANAMRVLARIIDATMLGAIERYLKQAIVDRNAFVASSALMAGTRLFTTCPEIVRRWINEVQEAVNSSSEMVQYHALSLLYKIRQHDRLAVSKTVQQLSKGSLRSPLATCLLIRYTSSLLTEDTTAANARASYQFLEGCLRHKSDMVIYEAAKAICNLPGVDANDLAPAITMLQVFLSSYKPALRFAAMRALSEVAAKKPASVARCNDDMEGLVSDSNRSIATLAITTLLKTGSEASIDRLMKQITTFMSEIGDEFKIVVVKAIRELCLKYPAKHRVMIAFLSTFLREEGGYDFKRSIVDVIVDLMHVLPDTKESSLLHLCEFIEDCEHDELIIQVLHLIGSVGPGTLQPSRYIRFIYNRVILESKSVRAAAVSALGSFAMRVPELKPSIVCLLEGSAQDEDDEVRDRAAMLLAVFASSETDAEQRFLIDEPIPMTFTALERSIKAYMAHPQTATSTAPITFDSLPNIEEAYVPASLPAVRSVAGGKKKADAVEASEGAVEVIDPAAAVYKVPQLVSLGRALHSAKEVPLTETEMEYVVTCVKHVFETHVVLQFSVLNTLDDQRLTNVYVDVEVYDPSVYEVDKVVPAAMVRYGELTSCFVALKRLSPPKPVSMSCELKFHVVQVDPTTGEVEGDEDGDEEEYKLEDLEIGTNLFMSKGYFAQDFRRSWEEAGTDGEVLMKFALQFKKLEDATVAVLDMLGMQAVDNTKTVLAPEGPKRTHALHMSGKFTGTNVLARAQLQTDETSAPGTVVLKLAVRSNDKELSQLVAECIN